MPELLVIVSVLCLTLLLLSWLQPALLRPPFWMVAHGFYRFRIAHRDRIPAAGGVLIVCNHTSLIDWLMLWVACPRAATFVLWSGYYQNPLLRLFLSWGRRNTIRLDPRTSRPRAVMDGLAQIAATLNAGRVVVLFPEGGLTRSGNMLPFNRGVERVLAMTNADVVVIPTAIHGLWGGYFSHGGGPILRKRPRRFRPRVSIWFHEPFSRNKTAAIPLTAANLRLAVQEASADLAIWESDEVPLVHRAFLANATRWRYFFRTCVIDCASGSARRLNWGKTLVAVLCVTRYLRARLGEDRNIGVWLPTSLAGMLANLAIAFLGRTSVNLNYTAGTAPVHSALRQAGVRTVLTSRRFLTRVPLELPEGVVPIYLEDVLAAVTRWKRLRTLLMVALLPGWWLDRIVLGLHRHHVDDPLTIMFSSGSTGEPKGVVLTHRNIGHNVDAGVRTIGIEPWDRLFSVLPFFHSFGYTVCLWAPLVSRCAAVLYPDPRQAKEVGELARTHRASILLSTATFLRFYIRRCDRDDFRSLRILICGAEKLPIKLQVEFHHKFGLQPLEGYGCTELSPVVSCSLPDIVVNGIVQERNHPGTVGQPILGVCARAFRIEPDGEREPLPVGVEGVLCIKGPNVMSGYLHQLEKTREAIRDGWYNTGDQGLIEPDGFIRITGRVSRFAKIAGEMVPLERLDDELHDVLGSGERVLAVTAVPDEKRGERLIVLHLPDIKSRILEVLDALSKRGLPNLWVPDHRDCHTIEMMPVLGSGKLDIKKLCELAREIARSR